MVVWKGMHVPSVARGLPAKRAACAAATLCWMKLSTLRYYPELRDVMIHVHDRC